MVNVRLIIGKIHSRLYAAQDLDKVPDDISTLLKNELWRSTEKEDGTTYGSNAKWPEFRAHKAPYGLGVQDKDTLLRLCRDHPVLKDLERAEHLKPGPKAESSVDNINRTGKVNAAKGTSRAYTLQRLERERPDLLAKVEAKELSAHAAALEAGFRRKRTALQDLKLAWKKADDGERNAMREWFIENCLSDSNTP